MLRDNALKFDSDHAYIIPHKPIKKGQYMNKMREILDGDRLHLGNCKCETELI